MTLKVALVGCGKAADMHVSGIQRLPEARLVAVCDVELLMAEQLARRFGIRNCYTYFDDLLEAERPDVVHIATPPASHFSMAMDSLDAGCHVVVEKPLALDSRQAVQLIAHAESCWRKLTIGYTYHFDPAARILRRLVHEGILGDPVHLEAFFGYNLKGAFGTPILADRKHWVHTLPGKLFHNLLDHLLDEVSEYLPVERPVVQSYAWQYEDGSYDLPDELRVILVAGSTSAYLTFSAHARPVRHFLSFYGTKSSANVDFDNSTITMSNVSGLPGILERLTSPFGRSWQHIREGGRNILRFAQSDYHFFSGFNYLVREFYRSITHDSPLPIGYDELLRTARLVEEIVHQVQSQGMRIE